MAAPQAAAAAVPVVEHEQERNQEFGEQSILEAFNFIPKTSSYHPLNNGFDSGRADLSSAAASLCASLVASLLNKAPRHDQRKDYYSSGCC